MIKRNIAVLLCIVLLLTFFSCDKLPDSTDNNVTTVDTAEAVNRLDLAEYCIIRPEGSVDEKRSKLYSDVRSAVEEKTGKDITISDDFIREGTKFTEHEYEILIGETNRKESAAAIEGKEPGYYAVKVIGTKIVINGITIAGLTEAVYDFIDKVLPECENGFIGRDVLYEGSIMYDTYYESLMDIKLNVIGDSYLKGDKLDTSLTWPSLLGEKYSMTVNNYGMNGSTVTNFVTTNNPMVVRYANMANGADIVLVEGGRNDYNKGVPLGTVDSTETTTYGGAINFLITKLQEKYPDKLILFVTAWYVETTANAAGRKMQEYNEMMLAVCEKRGIPCFNASDVELSGVYMTNPAFREKYCLTASDISHLNKIGHVNVMPAFEKFIGDEWVKFNRK